MLELARALTGLAVEPPAATLATALDALATAFHPGAPLPRALAHARIAALRDKTSALALAWAREQLRLGLAEVLGRAAAAGTLRPPLAPASLAWFTLAACEALADEPPLAAPDRVRLLTEWLTGARPDA
jgi:hypothetical protein